MLIKYFIITLINVSWRHPSPAPPGAALEMSGQAVEHLAF